MAHLKSPLSPPSRRFGTSVLGSRHTKALEAFKRPSLHFTIFSVLSSRLEQTSSSLTIRTERKKERKSLREDKEIIKLEEPEMQKSLSAYNQPFIPCHSPSSTTINQLANMFQLGNSLTTTTTTTTTTSKTDSENRVIFADPCSKCVTKKRRVSPIHQNQDFFFSPRKKLLIQSPPPPSTTTISPFQTNSASPQQPILSSPSSDPASFLRRCNSLPSSIENNRNNAIAPKSPVSFIKLDSFAKSPENRPSVSQPASYLGQLGSFSASSGSTAEGSPVSASKPPRPPKLSRSISDPLPTSSPGTKILSLRDQKGLNILKDFLAAMNQLVNGSTQKEEAGDHKDDNENKQVSESNGEENAETEGNPVGMFKCSCGKGYKLHFTILSE